MCTIDSKHFFFEVPWSKITKKKRMVDVVVRAKAISTSVPLSRQLCMPFIEELPHHPYIKIFAIVF